MKKNYSALLFGSIVMTFLFLVACHNNKKPPAKEIVDTPEKMDEKAGDIIDDFVRSALNHEGKIDDSVLLKQVNIVKFLYDQNKSAPAWSTSEKWIPSGDTLYSFIENARLYGLFPEDYHFKELSIIRTRFLKDTGIQGDRKDAALWARADVMLTDAFAAILKDIKLGRLSRDSITLRKDSTLADTFYQQQYDGFIKTGSLSTLVTALEPKHPAYQQLKRGIKRFLDSADFSNHTYVLYHNKDTIAFKRSLQQRLYEGKFISFANPLADSAQLANALKKFQRENNLEQDGKIGEQTVRKLNDSDRERFIRIAISLDRYKMLPSEMPSRYLWVNLPGYYLQLREGDSVKIYSKTIVGKTITRTPVLNSAISQIITYPQWSIPQSIIVKEVLPAAKRSPGYFAKKGFSLLNAKNEEVDPYSVDWSMYKKGIPYRVIQGSGDDNALGVLKFNFNNKYAVYLHDTNQRYLFSRSTRAISHGCVRVQDWSALMYYILQNDNLTAKGKSVAEEDNNVNEKDNPVIDSVKAWLDRKERHSIAVKNKIPLFIRYITCEGKNGRITFYDDIYGEDRRLRERYFANK